MREAVAVPDYEALLQPQANREVWAKEVVSHVAPEERVVRAQSEKAGIFSKLFKKNPRILELDEGLDTEQLYQKGLATIKDLIAPPALSLIHI